MTQFKPGDRVRCVDNTYANRLLARGSEYTVEKVGQFDVGLRGHDFWFAADRFELVQPNAIDAICRGEWPAGTRVRCVLNTGFEDRLTIGAEYVVSGGLGYLIQLEGFHQDCAFRVTRFKPVVRVPMGRRDEVFAPPPACPDCARMRKAGGKMAEAALYVVHEYDGTHRLALAVADWSKAVANEGYRETAFAAE